MTTAAPHGSDWSTFVDGVADLDPMFGMITDSRRVVAEAIARRLMQPAGTLEDDPRYGYDLREELGARLSAVRKIRIGAAIVAQCQEDPRVISASVTTIDSTTPGYLRIAITATLASGPFDLVLGVDAVTIEMLRVSND